MEYNFIYKRISIINLLFFLILSIYGETESKIHLLVFHLRSFHEIEALDCITKFLGYYNKVKYQNETIFKMDLYLKQVSITVI